MKTPTLGAFLSKKGIDSAAFAENPELAAKTYSEYHEEVSNFFLDGLAKKATSEELDAIKTELKGTLEEQARLSEILRKQGVMLNEKSRSTAEPKQKTIREQLTENVEILKAIKAGEKQGFKIEIPLSQKAVGDMSLAGNVTGQVPQAMRIAGLDLVPERAVVLLSLITNGSISSNLVEWVYQSGKEGAAGTTVEGATKNKIDFDILVGSQRVEKYTDFIRVTDEMLDDISFIEQEIRNELVVELLQSVEAAVYGGNGVTPNLNGITNMASAFAAGVFAASIDNANYVDVLTVAANQVAIAEHREGVNTIMMHPSDVTFLKMVKVSSTDRRYVERLAMVAGELSLDGIRIVATTLVTAGTYLIGYFPFSNLLTKQSVTVEIGYNGNDFTENFKTIRAEWRGVHYIKNNKRTAFVTGTFATDMAALETP